LHHGKTQGSEEAHKAQGLQIKALLLLALFSLSAAQALEPEPESSSTQSKNGLVSYILTCKALETKCKDLNCTCIICSITKQIVVEQDPEGVSALSVDPALNAANQNVKVSLDYYVRDYITIS